MEKTDPVRSEVTALVFQNCGEQVGKFFSNTYQTEILPIFLHHSFLVLKELIGESKAREQLDGILRKHTLEVSYE